MPTPQNATLFAPRGFDYNLTAVVKNSASGNPLTGGLTNARAYVSMDDGPFMLTTSITGGSAPVERGATGWVSLDIPAAVMAATKVDIEIRADNANAVYPTISVTTADLSPQAARYDLLTGAPRLERLFLDVHDFLYNRQYNEPTLQRIFNAANAQKGAAAIIENDESGYREKIV